MYKEKHSTVIKKAGHKELGSLESGESHHISSLDSRSSPISKRDTATLVNAYNTTVENTKQHKKCMKVSYGIFPDWQAERSSLSCPVGWWNYNTKMAFCGVNTRLHYRRRENSTSSIMM